MALFVYSFIIIITMSVNATETLGTGPALNLPGGVDPCPIPQQQEDSGIQALSCISNQPSLQSAFPLSVPEREKMISYCVPLLLRGWLHPRGEACHHGGLPSVSGLSTEALPP